MPQWPAFPPCLPPKLKPAAAHGSPMTNAMIEETAGAVLISRLSSLPVAIWIRDCLKKAGFQTSVGIIPGIPGYQVSVYVRSLADVIEALHNAGIKIKDA